MTAIKWGVIGGLILIVLGAVQGGVLACGSCFAPGLIANPSATMLISLVLIIIGLVVFVFVGGKAAREQQAARPGLFAGGVAGLLDGSLGTLANLEIARLSPTYHALTSASGIPASTRATLVVVSVLLSAVLFGFIGVLLGWLGAWLLWQRRSAPQAP